MNIKKVTFYDVEKNSSDVKGIDYAEMAKCINVGDVHDYLGTIRTVTKRKFTVLADGTYEITISLSVGK